MSSVILTERIGYFYFHRSNLIEGIYYSLFLPWMLALSKKLVLAEHVRHAREYGTGDDKLMAQV